MPPALPQELIDKIVDVVHPGSHLQERATTLALLRAAPCFGARCRKHLYHTVYLALEITDSSVIEKKLNVQSLRFVELVQRTPSLASLVKSINYNVYFELDDTSCIASTPAWHALRSLAQYLMCVDEVVLQGYDTREIWDSDRSRDEDLFRMALDSNVLDAISLIIPSCPFPSLTIVSTALSPAHLLQLLALFPHTISLELSGIGLPPHNPISETPPTLPKIEDIKFHDSDYFFFEMVRHDACRSLFASVRRLAFEDFETANSGEWAIIGDFISQLVNLEIVSLHGDRYGEGYDVRALVHAPSLSLRMFSDKRIPDLSSAFKHNPGFPSKLRRLTLMVECGNPSHDYPPTIAYWQELASVLRHPRFAALETVRIEFAGGHFKRHPHFAEEVVQCFKNAKFSAEATVR